MTNSSNDMNLCIIIPAYNAYKTIDITLNSIKEQDIDIDFETIIVNDCSDSNYAAFVNKYKDFFNIREIKTPSNLGPGGARQFGIDNSISKYIVFIDADDYFYKNDSLKKMYDSIVNTKADLVIGDFLYERDKKVVVKKHSFVWLHGKIYSREFLDRYNIRFNNTRANEDNGFNRLILLLRPIIVYLDEIVYVYKENPDSITRRDNRLYKLTGLEGFCYNMNWAMDEALKRNVNKNLIFALAQSVLGSLYYYYLDLEVNYDVSNILIWGRGIKDKYDKYIEFGKDIEMDFEEKKESLKDDISIEKERMSFEEFLELIK